MLIQRRINWMLLIVGCLIWGVSACAPTQTTTDATSIDEAALPTTLAVLPIHFLPIEKEVAGDFPIEADSEKGQFVAELARGVVHNQLAGKGYDMRVLSKVDQNLGDDAWQDLAPEAICEKLDVDGIIYPEIVTATMVAAVAYDLFKIEARVKMFNRTGTELGAWKESASKRKISLPTSVVGLTATVVGAVIDEPAKKQMRLVIYDWGYRVSKFVPDNPQGTRLPEIVSVESNIDKDVFAAGDSIKVQVKAEKDLTCSFDLGEFKTRLPMAPVSDGLYQGVYVVQAGDQIAGQPLSVRLRRPNGVERVWIEAGASVTIDGILPPVPQKLTAQAGHEGVQLTWTLPQGEALKAFVVEKSTTAVGDFSVLAQSKQLQFLDSDVSQGQTYYYRVCTVDLAGNHSAYGPTVPVTVPFFDEMPLTAVLSGHLVPGVYRLAEDATIASGSVLSIGPGTSIIFEGDNRIVVDGILRVAGSSQRPAVFEGQGWGGIVVTSRGQAKITDAVLKGCRPCLETAGNAELEAVSIKGAQGDGLVLKDNGIMSLNHVDVSGCERGVVIAGGKGAIKESVLSGNGVGMDITGGDVVLHNSSLFDNSRKELQTSRKVVLEGNYLGAAAVADVKMDGDILIKSFLDAPYPHGRKVVLMDDKAITPEVLDRRFEDHKQKGIEAFTNRRYGDAHQALVAALEIRKDPEVFLYLAYTQSSLGEEDKMADTLEQGIAAFPYEVRLYQLYIKYLAANGQKEKALGLLDRAIKMNPDDQNLLFMKQYIGSANQ
ncbi:tetratricopeptide repeat protein [Desulfosarcina variabilis str. Montpellier]|uniref:hypothetical protein n=1 Tax=Desulfosarcina variabilis TaxID=2300 RepID=UPI003AFB6E89